MTTDCAFSIVLPGHTSASMYALLLPAFNAFKFLKSFKFFKENYFVENEKLVSTFIP